MLMNEIKIHLRKLEFPVSVEEALRQVEELCACIATPQQQHLLQEIQEEFIFCTIDSKGVQKKRLNCVMELELLEVLSLYCQRQTRETIRNSVFLTLFHFSNTASPKLRILHKLVSIAIASQNSAVLNSSAIWMQQLGCRSEVVVSLVRELVMDYFIVIPNTDLFLSDLTTISPLFTTHFITAVTCLYSDGNGKRVRPPLKLLELITNWVSNSPHQCLTSLTTDLKNSLPRGSIAMPAITPIPGLIRWCVEAPILKDGGGETEVLFSRLHLGVVEALQCAGKLRLKGVMMTRDVVQICDGVVRLLHERGPGNVDPRSCNLALDRLGQAIQVAVAIDCLHGNREEVYACIKNIPENRLLNIFLRTNVRR